ncbi:hypothetical protein [Vibrio owensii]|uniref:hypothetical protein n=1 Tax=Vibrio owensii TaxID=696485 RepID=UPI003CC59C47
MNKNDLAQKLARDATLRGTFARRINEVAKIPNIAKAQSVLDKKSKQMLAQLKKHLDTNPGTILNDKDVHFRELYAHDRCYALMEGLMDLYNKDPEIDNQAVVVANEQDLALHWLVKFEYNDKTYYSDAYGLFESLDEVMARYQLSMQVKECVFDHCEEEDPWYEAFTDLSVETSDEYQGILEEALGRDDLDLGEVLDYSDFMYQRDAFEAVEGTFVKERELAPAM